MLSIEKKFLLCWKYEKDIWGDTTVWHKISKFAWLKLWNILNRLKSFSKGNWGLKDFQKWLLVWNVKLLTFSFEIIWWIKWKKRKKMKNWMRFFFLIKILRLFYGNFTWKRFYDLCNLCLIKKYWALFFFFEKFEFWLPMFIYRSGFAQTYKTAKQWVKHGHVQVNDLTIKNVSKQLKLYDFITFDPKIWYLIILSYSWIFFYASWSTKRRRCYSIKYAKTKNWYLRAHFIGIQPYVFPDFWIFSLYWWGKPTPTDFKYYFSINLSNVIKHLTL